MQTVQQQSQVEMALREKRNIEMDLDSMRDKMKCILKEKLELENNLQMI